jgi:hypothetical protein
MAKTYKPTASEDEDFAHNVSLDTTQTKVQQDEDLAHDSGFEEDHLAHQPFKRNFGSSFVCLFYKGEPLITIGPHCKRLHNNSSKRAFSVVYDWHIRIGELFHVKFHSYHEAFILADSFLYSGNSINGKLSDLCVN